MTAKKSNAEEPTVIKKYANRRLYNTATSRYVTLEDLCEMVKDGEDFVVFDAKSGDDITRSVLTQIIVEEESKGTNLLPISFLRQLISFYGDNMQSLVPSYLEHSMQAFHKNQDQFRDYFSNTLGGMGGMFPMGQLEEMSKQNMAMFENAMKMFTPFSGAEGGDAAKPATSDQPRENGDPLKDVEDRINSLQEQIEALKGGKGK